MGVDLSLPEERSDALDALSTYLYHLPKGSEARSIRKWLLTQGVYLGRNYPESDSF